MVTTQKDVPSNLEGKDEKESETLVIKTNVPNYLLDNLEPGKEYQVKVKAHNNIGLSKEPTKKTFKTSSGEPNKIKKIDCVDVYSGILTIEWKEPEDNNIQSKNENGYSPNPDSLVFKTGSTHLVGIEKAKRVKIGTTFCKLKWKEPDDEQEGEEEKEEEGEEGEEKQKKMNTKSIDKKATRGKGRSSRRTRTRTTTKTGSRRKKFETPKILTTKN
ncbi:fibronectin type-iii domain-containing protein 3a-like protein [Anaeramoeba flamelloides]|uniref:Fibronectin type-iii domain-containing protein 3a-like protein n=1 Tax=Anaeramoeba flamelloides TaxID=1746091 RepID=A0AAV7Y876_9EUKA|nr:fibronectin type-iii domain-containing protein 3a-like protein [Anaeramoeba flamelloides]